MNEFHPIKVAAFGSCVTRDNLNRTFNPGYKDLFDAVALADHVSVVSLMSDPVEVEAAALDGLEPRVFSNLQREFSRAYLAELTQAQPHYLIEDFWPDLIFGFDRLSTGQYITNNAWSTMNTTFYTSQEVDACRINHRTDEFMEPRPVPGPACKNRIAGQNRRFSMCVPAYGVNGWVDRYAGFCVPAPSPARE